MTEAQKIPHVFLVVRGLEGESVNVTLSACADAEIEDDWLSFVREMDKTFRAKKEAGLKFDKSLANFLAHVRDDARKRGFFAELSFGEVDKLHMYWVLVTPTHVGATQKGIRDMVDAAWKGPGLNYSFV